MNEIKAADLKIGQDYVLKHSRFGTATVHVHSFDDEWVHTTVSKGVLRGIAEEWYPGDAKTVRISNSKFYPVAEEKET